MEHKQPVTLDKCIPLCTPVATHPNDTAPVLSDILQKHGTATNHEDGSDALAKANANGMRDDHAGVGNSSTVSSDEVVGLVAGTDIRENGLNNDTESEGQATRVHSGGEDSASSCCLSTQMKHQLTLSRDPEKRADCTPYAGGIQPYRGGGDACSLATELEEFEKQMACFEQETCDFQPDQNENVPSKSTQKQCPEKIAATDDAACCQVKTCPENNIVHCTYSELYNAVPMDMVVRMKIAMEDIPDVSSPFHLHVPVVCLSDSLQQKQHTRMCSTCPESRNARIICPRNSIIRSWT
jgi:hypothetical protein